MSNLHLPPETLDYIVDLLHDDPNALKACCLVSKSWVARTRKHLFAEVELRAEEDLESWKRLFPDPSTSPAHFSKSLHVGCADAVRPADAEMGGWLTGFARIVHLDVKTQEGFLEDLAVSLVPFHAFSRTIKSLHVDSIDLPLSRIFDFVLSSPLLEDLSVANYKILVDDDGSDSPLTSVQPSNPPVLTGSLKIFPEKRMKHIAGRLLSIPGGIHFRKLTLKWNCGEDLLSIIELVRECSHTLESLDIICDLLHGTSVRYLRSYR